MEKDKGQILGRIADNTPCAYFIGYAIVRAGRFEMSRHIYSNPTQALITHLYNDHWHDDVMVKLDTASALIDEFGPAPKDLIYNELLTRNTISDIETDYDIEDGITYHRIKPAKKKGPVRRL